MKKQVSYYCRVLYRWYCVYCTGSKYDTDGKRWHNPVFGSVVNAPCSVSADSERGIVILDQVTLDSMGAKGETSGQLRRSISVWKIAM
jgi:type 1 fimbria pilin